MFLFLVLDFQVCFGSLMSSWPSDEVEMEQKRETFNLELLVSSQFEHGEYM